MATALATASPTSLVFGETQEIEIFAKRIKTMMRGGEKLSVPEAMALAQVATVTRLNPFIGEVWYIPGSGPMVGIAGARRMDQENAAGRGGHSTVEVIPCSPLEAGATEAEAKDVAAAFRAEISDSMATLEYQKMFTATLRDLRESGITDPVPVAREICGPRPKWVGYGFSKKAESTRMSKVQAARKRAESDALKKKIVIPFGAEVAETDANPEYVDVVATDIQTKRTESQNLRELGYEDVGKEIDAKYPPTDQGEEIYNEALKRVMKIVVDNETKEVAMESMSKKQLQWVIDHATIQANADAALVVMQRKFGAQQKDELTTGQAKLI